MGIVYASFGVPRRKKLGFFNNQLLCLTTALIQIKMSIELKVITKNGILVSPSIVGMFIFSTIVNISWFQGRAYHSMIHRLF
jgi:hypothetical protein